MDTIHAAVLCACSTALGLTLAEHIFPPERFVKQMRVILALLLMTAILRPLTKLDFSEIRGNYEISAADTAELESLAEQARSDALAESIAAALNRALEAENVPCRVTSVTLHILPDGGIDITEVKAEGNLLTGSVYLHDWLGEETAVTEGGAPDA